MRFRMSYVLWLCISGISGQAQFIGFIDEFGVRHQITTSNYSTKNPLRLCAGQCYQFVTRADAHDSMNYELYDEFRWEIPGALPTSSTLENPYVCFFDTISTFLDTIFYSRKLKDKNTGKVFWGLVGFFSHITIFCPPVSDFSQSARRICADESIVFSDSSYRRPDSWRWEFDGGEPMSWSGSDPPPVHYSQAGSYGVRLTTSNYTGADTLIRDQTVQVLPGVSHNPDFVAAYEGLAGHDTLLTTCATGDIYRWTPADGLSCTDCAEPLLTFGFAPRYTCVVSDPDGLCPDSCTIDIRSNALTERVLFPNVFTPNHDGVNDEFAGSTWYATILSLRIYNRWGGCVYTSTTGQPWDGTYQGQSLDPGVFVYVVTYRSQFTNEVKTQAGSVTLLR